MDLLTGRRNLVDPILAACVAGWGIGALSQGTAVGVAIAALHFCVAGLFLIRRTERERASWTALGACVPAIVAGAVVLEFAPHPTTWPAGVTWIFIGSVALAIVSLVSLGRSFAILPAKRELVTGGAYGVVRHPAYAAELLMVCIAAGTLPWSVGLPLAVVSMAVVALRVKIEERLWASEPGHAAYRTRVAWKLAPGVW